MTNLKDTLKVKTMRTAMYPKKAQKRGKSHSQFGA